MVAEKEYFDRDQTIERLKKEGEKFKSLREQADAGSSVLNQVQVALRDAKVKGYTDGSQKENRKVLRDMSQVCVRDSESKQGLGMGDLMELSFDRMQINPSLKLSESMQYFADLRGILYSTGLTQDHNLEEANQTLRMRKFGRRR